MKRSLWQSYRSAGVQPNITVPLPRSPISETNEMPGIDYKATRENVRLADVLTLLAWRQTRSKEGQQRGPCPAHHSTTPRSTSFAVHGEEWYCHRCKIGGDAFDLWAACTNRPLWVATVDLCSQLGAKVVWLPRRPAVAAEGNGEGER